MVPDRIVPSSAVSAGAVPWYGIVCKSTPMAFWNSMPHSCDTAPSPAFARFTLLWFCLI
ncbi:hypothetical protein D3C87_2198550 [compost metagenome]